MPEILSAPVATKLNPDDAHFILQEGLLKRLPHELLMSQTTADWYNVMDYGLKGDGATNDGPALQALIDTIGGLQRNAVIFFPTEGPYIISSGLQDTSRTNCQIKFPSVALGSKQYTITLKGCSRPTFSPSAYNTVVLPGGTKLKSTLTTGGGTDPSFFGGRGPVGGANFECSYMVPGFENIIVQTVTNPLISAIDFYHFTNTFFKDVSVLAGNSQSVIDSVKPTTVTSWGVRQPTHSSGINQRVEGALNVLGFYNGMHIGEGSIINDLGIWSCKYGMNYEFSPGQSFVNRCIVGWCPYTIRVSIGQHAMRIAELDIERWVPGPTTPSGWYDFISDLEDPSNYGQGEIVYRTVVANVGYLPGAFTKTGGTGIYIHELGKTS